MRIVLINIVALSLLFGASISKAQSTSSQTLTIDRYVSSLSKLRRKAPTYVFADVADYEAKAPKWEKFRSEAALEKHRDGGSEAYTIAYVWAKNGKVVGTNVTHFSPSGDWTEYVYSYYRPDGSLARADVDFRTFYGDLMILQKVYFDAAGKVIKRTKKSMDLMTRKPKKAGADFTPDSELMSGDFYRTTAGLPFASMVK
jgi:hypothetical protein